ncbi:TIGR03943 family putative permease subunit [Paenibacillus hamazuiensis]|uniref:TIGR03943 family putative permease subunit n=1 Tax=Paenibacillus hamazuiensis TaxID=2936508 RepID=UPI00200C278E|nr:TIGR03943 family protein [Paenibacillus hamazuiensis]
MASLSVYIVFLVKNENLVYYIAPRMQIFVKLASLALFAMAVFQLYAAVKSFRREHDSCGCEHLPSRSLPVNVFIYSLFIVPLLLGFLLPDSVMNSNVIDVKGINLTASLPSASKPAGTATIASVQGNPSTPSAGMTSTSSPSDTLIDSRESSANADVKSNPVSKPVSEDDKLKEMFQADKFTQEYAKMGMYLYKQDVIQIKERSFIDSLTSLAMYPKNFVGKSIEISGFVYREDDMKPNQFVIARFAMQCCSADAAPFGVLVESPLGKNFSKDEWVKVSGTLATTTRDDMEIIKLNATKIGKIPAPKTPYVYPDPEFPDDIGK